MFVEGFGLSAIEFIDSCECDSKEKTCKQTWLNCL